MLWEYSIGKNASHANMCSS